MSQGCCCCGASASFVMHPLELVACDDCFRAWIREESLSVDSILAAKGEWRPQSQTFDEHSKAFDAELLTRTRAWIAERKTARAAA